MSPRRRAALAAAALVAGLTAAVALAAAGGLLAGPEGIPDAPPGTASIADAAAFEPFALDEVSEDELLERARAGFSHPLYAFSPGGAPASAARTARFRAPLEAAAGRHGIGPDTLEALVMLESAGPPDVAAGDDPEGAVGLGQILPGTATALLGMRVDLGASKRLSAAIERVRRRAERARSARTRRAATRRAAALARRRRAVDKRYDPARSLDGAARYLAIAERRFGREDLALASYHMGMGNLERTVETYVAPARPAPRVRDRVAAHDVSYVRLYFGSSPVDNATSVSRPRARSCASNATTRSSSRGGRASTPCGRAGSSSCDRPRRPIATPTRTPCARATTRVSSFRSRPTRCGSATCSTRPSAACRSAASQAAPRSTADYAPRRSRRCSTSRRRSIASPGAPGCA